MNKNYSLIIDIETKIRQIDLRKYNDLVFERMNENW